MGLTRKPTNKKKGKKQKAGGGCWLFDSPLQETGEAEGFSLILDTYLIWQGDIEGSSWMQALNWLFPLFTLKVEMETLGRMKGF